MAGEPSAGPFAEAVDPDEELDRALVVRTRQGDAAAFDELVSRHLERAFRIAFRVMRYREDAEDLVQDAFVAALGALDGFDNARPLGPWLNRIVVNRGLNARKRRALRATDAIPLHAATTQSPQRDAERAELRERLTTALDELPERQQVILRLFELEGFSAVEIGDLLELAEGTVRWHVHQARKRLRAALGAYQRSAR